AERNTMTDLTDPLDESSDHDHDSADAAADKTPEAHPDQEAAPAEAADDTAESAPGGAARDVHGEPENPSGG
ncbi:hypothetical protein ACC691_40045, partial [Rhizobium johnstonii]|uniref:hypothetical protein n=1 Tax=Rhizobium johnstonii TaxID=3019933 RepID=UPI003F9B5211